MVQTQKLGTHSVAIHQSAIADDDPMSLFTSILKDIAEETVSKTLVVQKRFSYVSLSMYLF